MVRSGVLCLVLSGIVVGFRGVGGVLIRAGVGLWGVGLESGVEGRNAACR